jgi:hypothetical protein
VVEFFLGTHMPSWLERTNVPLFVSRRRMTRVTRKPTCDWGLDSGGFSELTMYGAWTITEEDYVAEVKYFTSFGRLRFAAAMDWMCEPQVMEGGMIAGRRAPGTGLTVREHQDRTVDNYLRLVQMAPELPWLPILQGYEPRDYLACARTYEVNGVDLKSLPAVGLGSVCRRQSTGGIVGLCRELHGQGIRLHGFGLKMKGLLDLGPYLRSCDSMAWSYEARMLKSPSLECRYRGRKHINCANCMDYAMSWRDRVVKMIP